MGTTVSLPLEENQRCDRATCAVCSKDFEPAEGHRVFLAVTIDGHFSSYLCPVCEWAVANDGEDWIRKHRDAYRKEVAWRMAWLDRLADATVTMGPEAAVMIEPVREKREAEARAHANLQAFFERLRRQGPPT